MEQQTLLIDDDACDYNCSELEKENEEKEKDDELINYEIHFRKRLLNKSGKFSAPAKELRMPYPLFKIFFLVGKRRRFEMCVPRGERMKDYVWVVEWG